ncbi:458_t:CDS:1 [Ambispora leptoticha]|uniref:458_t:CDS:1 n=1 Tax=Ambispora leptoticha TaxID=144679 RepID=A0A9N8W7Z3_9GLOM|nr:458_t:CDS:1 [Ambispora leptoticha]
MKIFGVGVVAFLVSNFLGKNLRPDLEAKYQREIAEKMIEENLTTEEELVKKALEERKQIDKFITEKKRLPTTMPLGNVSLFLGFITVVIIAPIVEECLCRYLIFEIFGKSNIFAYIFSGLIFIFLHWQGGILNFTALGLLLLNYLPATILFIYAYHESKLNITYPIYFHMM